MNMWLDPADITKAFNPDEPRDAHGAWTAGDAAETTAGEVTHLLMGRRKLSAVEAAGHLTRELVGIGHEVYGAPAGSKKDDFKAWVVGMLGRVPRDVMLRAALKVRIDKAFNPDEARDKYGKWTSSGAISAGDAADLHQTVKGTIGRMVDQMDKVHEGHDDLESRAEDAKKAEDQADKAMERNSDDEGEALRAQQEATKSAALLHHRLSMLRDMADSAAKDLESKMNDMGMRRVSKAFNPDEPRDEHGMWTSGAAVHPDKIDWEEGQQWYSRNEDMHKDLSDSLDKVYDANSKLWDQSSKAEDHRDAEPDADTSSKEYQNWNAKDDAHMQSTADRAVGVRNALADHIKFATDVLSDMDSDLQVDAEHGGGYRSHHLGKMYNPDQPRDTNGRWSTDNAGSLNGKAYLSHLNPDQADTLSKTLDKLHEAPEDVQAHHDAMSEHADSARDNEKDYHESIGAEDFKDLAPGEHFDAERDAITNDKENTADEAVNARDALEQTIHDQQANIKNQIAVLNEYDSHLDRFNIANEHQDPAAHPLEHLWDAKNVEKNLTVGDVHASTALGNENPKRRKARSFLSTIGEVRGARIVGVPAMGMIPGQAPAPVGKNARDILEQDGIDVDDLSDEEIERLMEERGVRYGKDGGTALVHLIRHGATDLNNHSDDSKDRIRAWLDPPLNEDGRKDAAKAAKKASKAGIQVVVSSDLKRAAQTAKEIGKAVGVEPITTPKLRPWDVGEFTGKPSKDAYPQIIPYVTDKPDEPIPGGESFNDFATRSMKGLQFAIDKGQGKPLAVVTHYRNLRRYLAWDEKGQPADHSIDHDEFNKKGGPPGELVEMEVNLKRLAGKQDGVAKAFGSPEALIEAAMSGDMAAMLEMLKKRNGNGNGNGGLNAALQLQPLNDEWAKSPFPWDQTALANLDPDEMKPFLGSLTDPDKLPVKSMRLNNVIALQDRVDPERVQSMVDSEPDQLPVVVRLNGRNLIVDGHHRMAALWLQGRKTGQVRYMDLNPSNANTEAFQEELTATSDGLAGGKK